MENNTGGNPRPLKPGFWSGPSRSVTPPT
ncbi:uncharacterized protein METZ01_LOCUS170942, partial [marine metagenome]